VLEFFGAAAFRFSPHLDRMASRHDALLPGRQMIVDFDASTRAQLGRGSNREMVRNKFAGQEASL
jgi:hypothetical protein